MGARKANRKRKRREIVFNREKIDTKQWGWKIYRMKNREKKNR